MDTHHLEEGLPTAVCKVFFFAFNFGVKLGKEMAEFEKRCLKNVEEVRRVAIYLFEVKVLDCGASLGGSNFDTNSYYFLDVICGGLIASRIVIFR